MTGATDHAGLIVLGFDECMQLVAGSTVGRIGFVTSGEVEILPVNHLVDGTTIAFRTLYGSKLGAAAQNAAVSFEVDGYDDAEGSGWSVLVKGRAEVVTDRALLARLERKGLRTYVTSVPRPQWVLIRPEAVTGRRVPEGG
jgi:nitroimidazol reductase NimA-like FMN-containing flavoprotein (pyridoxamine 5'-phosphate oxidase superfamily)